MAASPEIHPSRTALTRGREHGARQTVGPKTLDAWTAAVRPQWPRPGRTEAVRPARDRTQPSIGRRAMDRTIGKDEWIKRRARELWEQEGRPAEDEQACWDKAVAEYEAG